MVRPADHHNKRPSVSFTKVGGGFKNLKELWEVLSKGKGGIAIVKDSSQLTHSIML
jgi:hypothetical protein